MAATISTFAQAGAVFNGAVHLGRAGAVVGDLQTVRAVLQVMVGGESNGAGLARNQNIVAGLDPQAFAANAAGDGDGAYGSSAAAGSASRSSHWNAVAGVHPEPTLPALAMADGAIDLRVVPKEFALEVTARNATRVSLAYIGTLFDGVAGPQARFRADRDQHEQRPHHRTRHQRCAHRSR